MINSKLFKILSTFDQNDWKGFGSFLKYKIPRRPQEFILFEYIFNRKANLNSNKFLIDNIRISPEFGFSSKKKMQNIMSKLNLLLDEYLAIDSLKNDQHELNLRLFQSYNDRSLYSLANNKAESLIKNWGGNPSIDMGLFMYLLRLQHYRYFSENPTSSQEDRKSLHKLISTFKQFSQIYSQFYQFINSHAIYINSKDYFDEQNVNEYKILNRNLEILDSIKNLHTKNNIESFEFLYSQLLSGIHISSEMKTIIFEFCERFLRNEIRLGNSKEYLKKILDFYDFGMEEKLLLYKDAISSIKFQNIIQIACFAQNYEWAENFLNKNINLVPFMLIEENKSFAAIQINFGKRFYNGVLRMINTNDFKLFSLKTQSRWYLLVCYFIVHDNFEFMETQINNFNQFFYYNKNRISSGNYEGSLNLSKIIKFATSSNQIKLVYDEIDKYDNIIFKKRLPTIFEQRNIYIQKHNIKV